MTNKSKVNEQTQTTGGCNDSNGSKKCKEKMRKCRFNGDSSMELNANNSLFRYRLR